MAKKAASKVEETIVAYKGFDVDMKCRNFQYEVGKTYEHDGDVKACSSGFHSCTDPWDVFGYYDVTQRFAKVTVGGKMSTHNEDSKIASAKITIDAELRFPEYVKTCVSFLIGLCKVTIDKGGENIQSASGQYSKLAASGHSSKLAASGYSSRLAASGYSSRLAASGYSSRLAASGDSSRLAASGDYSQLAASGDYSKLAASGHSSKLAASGHSSKLAASGDYSQLAASGDYSIACNAGANGRVKGGKNCALSLAHWVEDEKRYRITVAYVGEDGIKENTWYKLDSLGKFAEDV